MPKSFKYGKDDELYFGDFNGDGKTDVLATISKAGTDPQWTIQLSDGTGTFVKLASPYTPKIVTGLDEQIYIMDLNGDGLDDIYTIAKTTNNISGGILHYAYINTEYLFLRNYVTCSNTNALDKSNYYTGDFNGDGRMDLVCTSNWKDDVWYGYQMFLMPTKTNNNLLASITDGLGNTTNITYKRMSDPAVFKRGANKTYPLVSFGSSWPVVYQVTTPDGIGGTNTTTYTYKKCVNAQAWQGVLGV